MTLVGHSRVPRASLPKKASCTGSECGRIVVTEAADWLRNSIRLSRSLEREIGIGPGMVAVCWEVSSRISPASSLHPRGVEGAGTPQSLCYRDTGPLSGLHAHSLIAPEALAPNILGGGQCEHPSFGEAQTFRP